jgi:hypothetical protein
MLTSYDILNNGKCPFCQNEANIPLYTSDKGKLYDHCYCINKCIKIMRIKNQMKWELFRVYLNGRPIRSLEANLNSECITCVATNQLGSQFGFNIPHFDIFSYSLDELKNKVKNYLIFL